LNAVLGISESEGHERPLSVHEPNKEEETHKIMAGINDLQHIGRHSRGGGDGTTPARTLEMLLRESRAVGVDVSHHRRPGRSICH